MLLNSRKRNQCQGKRDFELDKGIRFGRSVWLSIGVKLYYKFCIENHIYFGTVEWARCL